MLPNKNRYVNGAEEGGIKNMSVKQEDPDIHSRF